MRRFVFLCVTLSIVVLLTACGGGRPSVSIENAELIPKSDITVVNLVVRAKEFGSFHGVIQPTKDAVLRDNLGNEYPVLYGTEALDGNLGGGLLYTKVREGTLYFPVIDRNATTLSLTIPLYAEGVSDVLLFGSNVDRPDWRIGATWIATEGGFKIGSSYLIDGSGNVVAAQLH